MNSAILVAGALTGGALLVRKRFKKPKKLDIPLTTEQWCKPSDSIINKPKLSVEENERIVNEAIAGGQKWDVYERLNILKEQRCKLQWWGGRLLTSTRTDEFAKSRCLIRRGVSGYYYVHTSKKYGVKVHDFEGIEKLPIEQVEKMAQWELEMLDKAYKAGVNVPEPLALRSVKIRDKNKKQSYTDKKKYVMTMRHMDEYEPLNKIYPPEKPNSENIYSAEKSPLVVKIKPLREFRKLNLAGLVHGDTHAGNILIYKWTKKVGLIDFEYASSIHDLEHPITDKIGAQQLKDDLKLLTYTLKGVEEGEKFINKRAITISRKFAVDSAAQIALTTLEKGVASEDQWRKYRYFINQYYSFLQRDLLHNAYLTREYLS